MDLERFENNINDKFKNFEPAIDDSKIWDRIEGDLPSKKKRKPFWLIGFFLLPVACYCLLNVSDSVTESDAITIEKSNATTLEFNEDKKKSFLVEGETIQGSAPNDAMLGNTQDSQLAEKPSVQLEEFTTETVSARSSKQSNLTKEDKNKAIGLRAAKIFAQADSTLATSVDTESTFAQAEKTFASSMETESTFAQAEEELIPSTKKSAIAKTDKELDVILIGEELTVNETEIQLKNESMVSDPAENLVEKEERDEVAGDASNQQVSGHDSSNVIADVVSAEPVKVEQRDEDGIGIPSKIMGSLKSKSTISFTSGIFLANRIYDPSSDDQVALIIAEKESVEKQLESLQFDLQYKYRLNKKFALGVGLRQWRLTEKSSFNTTSSYDDSIDVVTGITHHVDGSTTEYFSTVPVTFIQEVENIRYQTHSSWSVPVTLYYALMNTRALRLELGLGYEYSFSGKHVGYELGADQTEYFITEDIENRYAKNGGNFLLANLNMDYKLNKSIGLIAGLEGKYGLNGFNTDATIYRKKYHFLGSYVGLSYTF